MTAPGPDPEAAAGAPPERLAGSLLDSLDAPLVAVDRVLRVRHANDAAERWLGRSRTKLSGSALARLLPPGARPGAADALVRLAGRALGGEAASEAGALLDDVAGMEATPWWDGDRVVGAVLLVRPSRGAAPATDVAALAAGLAHEIRNPLAALRGAAELLQAEVGAHEYLSLVLREAGRIDALVAHMMDLARPLPLAPRPFAPAELLHDLALEALALARARGSAARVEERFDPALPALFADRDRLFEALVNLLRNAVEAAPKERGRVVLEAAMAAERRRDASGRSVPVLRIAVRDNGPGLGEARERLFTPFFTTKAGGTGLGLLLARRAVEAHGGMLQLGDAPEGGTEARVLLPAALPAGGAP